MNNYDNIDYILIDSICNDFTHHVLDTDGVPINKNMEQFFMKLVKEIVEEKNKTINELLKRVDERTEDITYWKQQCDIARLQRMDKERDLKQMEELIKGIDVDNPSAVDTLIDALNIQKENLNRKIKELNHEVHKARKAQSTSDYAITQLLPVVEEVIKYDNQLKKNDIFQEGLTTSWEVIFNMARKVNLKKPSGIVSGDTTHQFKEPLNREEA